LRGRKSQVRGRELSRVTQIGKRIVKGTFKREAQGANYRQKKDEREARLDSYKKKREEGKGRNSCRFSSMRVSSFTSREGERD